MRVRAKHSIPLSSVPPAFPRPTVPSPTLNPAPFFAAHERQSPSSVPQRVGVTTRSKTRTVASPDIPNLLFPPTPRPSVGAATPPSPSTPVTSSPTTPSTSASDNDLSKKKSPARGNKGPDHIPRPPNAFMLFRRAMYPKLRESEHDHRHISRILGDVWRKLAPEDKEAWRAEARKLKEEHNAQYPGYRFKPGKRAVPPVRRKVGRNTNLDLDRDKAIAELMLGGKTGEELEAEVRSLDAQLLEKKAQIHAQCEDVEQKDYSMGVFDSMAPGSSARILKPEVRVELMTQEKKLLGSPERHVAAEQYDPERSLSPLQYPESRTSPCVSEEAAANAVSSIDLTCVSLHDLTSMLRERLYGSLMSGAGSSQHPSPEQLALEQAVRALEQATNASQIQQAGTSEMPAQAYSDLGLTPDLSHMNIPHIPYPSFDQAMPPLSMPGLSAAVAGQIDPQEAFSLMMMDPHIQMLMADCESSYPFIPQIDPQLMDNHLVDEEYPGGLGFSTGMLDFEF